MDPAAVRIVNILLGNPEGLSALELHFPAGEIRFTEQCIFALGGADFSPELDGEAIHNWKTSLAVQGQVLRFKARKKGHRCYLAIQGGLRFEPRYEKDPTNKLKTVRTRKGDRFFRSLQYVDTKPQHKARHASMSLAPIYSQFPTVRFLASGEFEMLDANSKRQLFEESFVITGESNRMGFRLKGPALSLAEPTEMVSSSVNFGTMQLLPDGQIVVLMADHQTSGGYPRIGNIISADLPLIGQLGAGDKIAFVQTTIKGAEESACDLESNLRKLEIGVRFGRYW